MKKVTKHGYAESYKLLRAMEDAGRMIDGFWQYNDGWSDERLANAFDIPVSKVKIRRREAFGEIKKTGDASRWLSKVHERIGDLEARIQALEDAATSPKKSTPIFNTQQPWKTS